MFTKELAIKIGVNLAVFIQQVYFMVSTYGKEDADTGNKKLRWTIDKWQRKVFPYWSERTLHRMIAEAEGNGWLIVERPVGATAHFSIDYDRLVEYTGAKVSPRTGAAVTPPQECHEDTPQRCHAGTPVPHIEKHTEERKEEEKKNRSAEASRVPSGKVSAKVLAENLQKVSQHQISLAKWQKKFEKFPTAHSAQEFWKAIVAEHFGRVGVPLTGRDTKNMKSLIKFCEEAKVSTLSFLEYCVENWAKLGRKLSWAKISDSPLFNTVFTLRSQIMEIYQKNGGAAAKTKEVVITDIAQVDKSHPQYANIAKLLKAVGSVTLHN
jgi:hypothetical protein